jgi:acyl-CoA synthetase (AMP-forming)/AMP-acid ligase II/acyl carrier protein
MPVFPTIPAILDAHGGRTPEATSLLPLDGPGLSFEELNEFTRRSANQLRAAGLGREDRVALVLPNGPEMATAFLTVARVATAAPLNPGLREPEFSYYLKDLEARAVVLPRDDASLCGPAARALGIPVIRLDRDGSSPRGVFSLALEEMPVHGDQGGSIREARAEDVALVLHTSGTTAKPKIVPLTHRNLCHSAANVAESLGLGPGDRCLNVMPLFHIHGLVAALLASLHSGASVVGTPGFDAARVLDWIEQSEATWYTAVPTMHQGILRRARERRRERLRGSRLRLIRSSSASLPPSVLNELEEVFGVPVIEAYGMTEAAHQMTSNPVPPAIRKPGSVGMAAGPEVRVADEAGRFVGLGETGEVVIRGPNVTAGYHGLTDQTSHFFGSGWFRTGDQGYLDPDGYLFLTGRLKEIINRGGETIAPREIDEALLELHGVTQAVAFAVPDPQLGEEVAAAVVLEKRSSATEAELQEALQDRLSWARMPKRILIVDEIPKGPTGKLQRIGLAGRLGLERVFRDSATEVGGAVSAEAGTEEQGGPSDVLACIRGLWADVLNVEIVDPDQAFLEVGGDSVSATTLVLRVEQEFGIRLPLVAFFEASTARKQAELVRSLRASG